MTQDRWPERQANVRHLVELARQFDPWQRQGLSRFLRFVAVQQEAEVSREPVGGADEDCVRLTSIHQSKGIEFPVVVLADLGKAFNFLDLRSRLLLDEEYGLCPQVQPPGPGPHYPSLPFWLARKRQRRELLGEELRLLYVALTRARDTLLLVGSANGDKARARWAPRPDAAPGDQRILSARRYLDWLGPWFAARAGVPDWPRQGEGVAELFRWRVHPESEPVPGPAPAIDTTRLAPLEAGPGDERVLTELAERLSWRYPHPAATAEPAKATVSGLRRRAAEDEEAPCLFPANPPLVAGAPGPHGRRLAAGTAAGRGSAHHLFLEWVALECVGSRATLAGEAKRLQEAGILSAAEAAWLDLEAVAAFWDSAWGRRIRAHPSRTQRELPFTARFSPAELAACGVPLGAACGTTETPSEFVVVQGVVDLAVVLEREIWVLDFKTDELGPAEVPARVSHYAPQLRLYAHALERIYRRPVSLASLHFLALGQTLAVIETSAGSP
jgi:ATP-dependent helicase/nuclease subunit A